MKDKIIFFLFFAFLLTGFKLLYDRQAFLKQQEQLKDTQKQLQICQENLQLISQQVELDRKAYQDKLQELLKQSRKQVKVITIPKVIEKHIYISDEDCKKMGVMIDEALPYFAE